MNKIRMKKIIGPMHDCDSGYQLLQSIIHEVTAGWEHSARSIILDAH